MIVRNEHLVAVQIFEQRDEEVFDPVIGPPSVLRLLPVAAEADVIFPVNERPSPKIRPIAEPSPPPLPSWSARG